MRWQLSVFLARAKGISQPQRLRSFADASAGIQQNYASIAIEQGWFEPCEPDNFCMNKPVSRAEMARIIAIS